MKKLKEYCEKCKEKTIHLCEHYIHYNTWKKKKCLKCGNEIKIEDVSR